jgi:precorrin-4/cobalt-precorrin-4 C11-methyltransferase
MAKGKVYFVGAGPGDPELITLKGYRILKEADVVIYTGSLINKKILDIAEKAQKIDSFGMSVEEICDLIEKSYSEGKVVVRLHDGDPSIFGSIKEHFEILESRGIDFEVVPGVSSFLAAASRIKIEYTVPEITQTVVITRYPGKTPVPEDIKEIAKQKPTLIFFLSASLLPKIVNDLFEVGYPSDFPCALCYKVTFEDEKIIFGTLSDITDKAKKEGVSMHALFIVSKAFLSKGKKSFVYSEKYASLVRKANKQK